MQTALVSQAQLIDLATKAGFVFGWGEPENRIRYWSTIGLIPHAVKKDGLGHYPCYTVDLLLKIQELQKQGLPLENIKAIVNREEMRLKVGEMLNGESVPQIPEPVVPKPSALYEDIKPGRKYSKKTIAVVAGLLFLLLSVGLGGAYGIYKFREAGNISAGSVLAGFSAKKFLQFNPRVKFAGSPDGFSLYGGEVERRLTVIGSDVGLDQNLTATSSPTFAGINLPATTGQIVVGGTGIITAPQATGTIVLDTATQTLTNKTISGSDNTFSNIPNSALSNSSITINTSGSLSGGGSVSLGGSISLSASGGSSGTTSTASAGFLTLQTSGGNLGNSVLSQSGGTLQVDGLNAVSVGSYSCVITTNGIVTDSGACPSGGGSKWQLNAGVLAPNDVTQSVALGDTASASAKIFLDGVSGNVGIGTGIPGANLHVVGKAIIKDSNDNVFISDGNTYGGSAWNVAIGAGSMNALQGSAESNVAVGYQTLRSMTVGTNNVALGKQALYSAVNSSGTVGLGDRAGFMSNSSQSVFIGTSAGFYENEDYKLYISTSNTAYPLIYGDFNQAYVGINGTLAVGIATPSGTLDVRSRNGTMPIASISGASSLPALVVDNSVGDLFTASSSGLSRFVITQNGNVGIGSSVPNAKLDVPARVKFGAPTGNAESVFINGGNETASAATYNLGLMTGALNSITSGDYNTAVGYNAGYSLTNTGNNVLMGYEAGAGLTGDQNVYLGNFSGPGFGQGDGNSDENIAIGYSAANNLKGWGNIIMGAQAGQSVTTGNYNLILGYDAEVSGGATSYSIALGYSATTNASNQMVVGGSGGVINDVYFGNGVTSSSPTSPTINASGGSGNNIAGGNLTLAGGKGTGNAAGGDIIFQTSDAGVSGSTLQSLTTKMTISELGHVTPGTDDAQDLGSNSLRWRDIYLGPASLHIGTATGDEGLITYDTGLNNTNISSPGNVIMQASSGNVGIGTTDPQYKLDVVGSMRVNGGITVNSCTGCAGASQWQLNSGVLAPTDVTQSLAIGGTATSSAKFLVYGVSSLNPVASISGSSSKAAFMIDNTVGDLFTASSSGLNRFVIKQNGGVGIGAANVGKTLDVRGPVAIAQSSGGTGALDIEPLANGAEFWTNTGYDPLSPTAGWTSTMALVNGNVGVGTTTASSQMHIYNGGGSATGLTVQNANAGGNPFIRVQGASSRSVNVYLNGGGTDIMSLAVASDSPFAQIHAASNYGLRFYTHGGSLAQTIDINGNVGIGSDTPGVRLDVVGSGTGGTIARFVDNNTTGCTLATGGTISCSSDVNLKKNIEELPYGLSEIMRLRPVEFNWKADAEGLAKSLGFIAQDVEHVVPKLVTTDPASGTKQLNTIGLVPIVVKALQEQQAQIAGLQEIPQIKSDLEKTREEMASVSARLANVEQKVEVEWPTLDLSDWTNADLATVAGDLKVTGLTQLAETSIGGKLTVGLLAFDDLDADISSLGEKFSIQDGAVLIGKNGDITTSGKIEAKSIQIEKINVLGEETSSSSASLKASIGTIYIEPGETSKVVQTTAITDRSKVFVSVVEEPVAVSARKIGDNQFEVKIKEPLGNRISVNWWVVN